MKTTVDVKEILGKALTQMKENVSAMVKSATADMAIDVMLNELTEVTVSKLGGAAVSAAALNSINNRYSVYGIAVVGFRTLGSSMWASPFSTVSVVKGGRIVATLKWKSGAWVRTSVPTR
jgi:hypothetical protein